MTGAGELRGEALRVFETWRALGLSEAASMEQLRLDGYVVEDAFGVSVRLFEAMGMTPAAARTAAVGRSGSEAAARESLRAVGDSGDDLRGRLRRAREALAAMSDAEVAQVVEGDPRLRARARGASPGAPSAPSGKAPRPFGGAGIRRIVEVREIGVLKKQLPRADSGD